MRVFACWVLVVGSLSFAGCKTSGRTVQDVAEDSMLSDDDSYTDTVTKSPVSNFGRIGPNLFRGGQLRKHEDRFTFLQSVGVKNIINLQTFHSEDDPKLCSKYGMNCIRHSINPLANDWVHLKFDWANFKAAFADGKASLERGEGLYVHCYVGKDRTGALITALSIYPTICSGEPYDAAELEKKIAESYEEFGVSLPMRGLKAEVMSWAKKPPAWLCDK